MDIAPTTKGWPKTWLFRIKSDNAPWDQMSAKTKITVSAIEATILGTLIMLDKKALNNPIMAALWVMLFLLVFCNAFTMRGHVRLLWLIGVPFALFFWATVMWQWCHA